MENNDLKIKGLEVSMNFIKDEIKELKNTLKEFIDCADEKYATKKELNEKTFNIEKRRLVNNPIFISVVSGLILTIFMLLIGYSK